MKTFIATNIDYRYTQVLTLCIAPSVRERERERERALYAVYLQKIMTHLFDYPEGPDVSLSPCILEMCDWCLNDRVALIGGGGSTLIM